ncbi:MAG: carboxypeptidase regulatory-like domain-containing protein, partial [Planctomycetes bacterium]|nr:carboxypeptidase regulatory-like domain-containing protein [Planctomycetota bacterium]
HVELDDDADFTSPIVSPDLGGPGDPEYGVTGVGVTSFQVDISLGLEANTPYHWRVRTVNGLESAWSATQTFTVVIPTYSLSGTIYDSDTVTPLEGVTVECYNSLAVKVREEDTEADGEYEFTGLPADTYQVVPVFDPFSFTPVGSDDHVTIVDSDITDFDFNLVDGAYKITGTITITGGGGPLEDAVVSIGIRSDDTNASGYYEITGLHDGNYTLAVTAPAGQYYTFTPDGWTQPVTISGSDQTGRDFDADEETFDVSGTVKDYDANLLGGIDIDAVKVGAPSSTASTTTAGNGTYTLADLSAGDWEITATDPGDTFVFVPSLATVTVPGPGGSDVEDIDFTGYPGSEHSYAVGLHLTGVPVYPIEGYAEDVFLSSDIWWWHPSGGV